MEPLDHAGEGARATRAARAVGLARALSKLGYCSRSQAAVLIRDGFVRLNGRVRRDPETSVNLRDDKIEVNDRPVAAREFDCARGVFGCRLQLHGCWPIASTLVVLLTFDHAEAPSGA